MGRAGVRRGRAQGARGPFARRLASLGETASCALQDSEGSALRVCTPAQCHGQGHETRGCPLVRRSRMNPAVASLLALILAIVLSIVTRINVGVVAVGLAWLIGVYVA